MSKLKRWAKRVRDEDKDLVEAAEKENFEKNDIPALIFAALITLLPVVLAVLALLVLIIWFIFDFLLGMAAHVPILLLIVNFA